MARMRVFMVLVLALTAGGALAFGTYNYMQQQPAKTRRRSRPSRWWSRPPISTSAPS